MKPSPTDPADGRGSDRAFMAVLATALVGLAALWDPSGVVAQPVPEAADQASAVEAATFLLVPLGARNVGFGGAIAGADADVEGALWNPAALAGIDEWAVYYHGSNDFGTSTHAVGGVFAWRDARFGLSLLSMDLGTIQARDASNQPLGTINPANTLAVVTATYPVSSVIDVGASYKFVRMGGSCDGCSGLAPDVTGHAFDLAVAARPARLQRLRIGLIVSNLGGGIAFTEGEPSDPLPTRIRLGGQYDVLRPVPDRPVELRVRADLRQTFTEFDDLDLFAGAEVGYRSIAYLRAGYAAAGAGRTGAALGVGVRYRGFSLDVGRSFDDFSGFDSDNPFQVSVAYQP